MMQSQFSSKNHRHTQEEYWKKFRKQLERLKDKKRGLSISYDEIAEGLGISRQRLSQFIQGTKSDLPIDRASILELWDHLTMPEALESKKLSREAQKNREELTTTTLDDLLQSIGFLPTSHSADKILPQIARVKSRLESDWITNSSVLSKITDNIIDTILDQGGLAKSKEDKLEKGTYSAEEAREWPQHKITDYDAKAAESFAREIIRLQNLGKIKFSDDELFELYQSIFENNILQDFNVRVRVTDCQFKTLTFSLLEEFEKFTPEGKLINRLCEVCVKCEKDLRSASQLDNPSNHPTDNEFLRFPPVLEASVTLNYRNINIEKSENLVLQYASSATHIGNMLVALSNGLGYLLVNTLEVSGFFIRAIGKSSDSLARVSISITDTLQLQNYQGLWVEGNVIVGILQAFLFASLNWLSDKIGSENLQKFLEICEERTKFNRQLSLLINDVYNHSYSYNYLTDKKLDEQLESLEKSISDVADDIRKLAKNSKSESSDIQKIINEFYEIYTENLAKKRFLATLARTHAAIVRSDSQKANIHLRELRSNLYMGDLQISSNDNFTPISILHHSEMMFYKLLCGDRDFIEEKEWRNSATDWTLKGALQKLRDYITHRNSGIIDVDVYLAIAQFYGIIGLVEFYVCQKKDIEHLENTIDSFLSAAYYSAKIGHHQRSARALCHASRVCCRLGEQEMANQILQVIDKLTEDASRSQFALSKGEILLRFGTSKTALYQALFHFLYAWQSSIENETPENQIQKRFFRSNIDSLYDIYRVFHRINKEESLNSRILLETINDFLKSEEGQSFLKQEKYVNKNMDEVWAKFQNHHNIHSKITFQEAELKMQEIAINSWNSCCRDGESMHPFSTWIRKGIFLEDCIKEKKTVIT
jgi:transcriptional regulator with XRE-family HTH domain